MGCKLVQPIWKMVWNFLKKLKIELTYDPIALLGIYPRDTGMLFQRDTCTQMLIAALSNKMWYIYTMEYYSAIKKNEILNFATKWMELECIMLSEISQSEKDKYHMTSLIWGL